MSRKKRVGYEVQFRVVIQQGPFPGSISLIWSANVSDVENVDQSEGHSYFSSSGLETGGKLTGRPPLNPRYCIRVIRLRGHRYYLCFMFQALREYVFTLLGPG